MGATLIGIFAAGDIDDETGAPEEGVPSVAPCAALPGIMPADTKGEFVAMFDVLESFEVC